MKNYRWLMVFIFITAQQLFSSTVILSEIIGFNYFLSALERAGDDQEVYRPETYFTSTQSLSGFRFEANGIYMFLEPGENNGPHVETQGRWKHVDNKIRIFKNDEIFEEIKLSGTKNRIVKEADCGCGG